MGDSLIDILVLAALGAGSLLQWWLKRQRAARTTPTTAPVPTAHDAAPQPRPAAMSIEDALAELFGGTPQPRPVMDWQPISAPQATAPAAEPQATAPAAKQEQLPQRLVANVAAVALDESAADMTAGTIRQMCGTPADLRRAFIMKELLDPPVSLR